MKKYFPVLLFTLSIGFLIAGITQPFMSIKADISKQKMFDLVAQELFPPEQNNQFIQDMLQSVLRQVKVEGSINALDSTRSLLETMCDLMAHNHVTVALLIGLFGVIIPLIKIILTVIALFLNSGSARNGLLKVSSLLSKWSMSDVFVIAILVAFLLVNANEYEMTAIHMSAQLETGFYFFVTYCLLALVAGQLLASQTASIAE